MKCTLNASWFTVFAVILLMSAGWKHRLSPGTFLPSVSGQQPQERPPERALISDRSVAVSEASQDEILSCRSRKYQDHEF